MEFQGCLWCGSKVVQLLSPVECVSTVAIVGKRPLSLAATVLLTDFDSAQGADARYSKSPGRAAPESPSLLHSPEPTQDLALAVCALNGAAIKSPIYSFSIMQS